MPTVGFEPGTFRAKSWAIGACKYRSPKGDRLLIELSILNSCTTWFYLTNCASLLADIFLYSYEAEFIQSLLSAGKKRLASQFNFTYRYIDDVSSINNTDFENYLGQMYPPELEIKDTTESKTSASYLDLLLSIGRDGQLRTSLYDKCDDFNFHNTNFPYLSSNIPSSPDYGVFISQLIWYVRACSSYECFILRAMRLSNKLLGQGYVKERLKSSLRKFYGWYGDLSKQYEVPLSRMLHDILDDDHIHWHPRLIGHYTNFWPLLIWTLLPNMTFYLIVQGFHRTYATGAACQQRTRVFLCRDQSLLNLSCLRTFEFRTNLGTSLLPLEMLSCIFLI